MKITLFFSIFFFCLCTLAKDMSSSQPKQVTLLHYNIKELDSTKLNNNNKQIKAVKKVLKHIESKSYQPGLISINELQYDFPGVPKSDYQTEGKNLEILKHLLNKKSSHKFLSFNPANTGLNSKPNQNGVYYSSPNSPQARENADQVNFGTIPGQYSSGLISKYQIKYEKIFSKIKWKDFNPKIDLSRFKLANGKPFPKTAPLFDKNFSDIVLDVHKKDLHVILLHTVPSYHFGNKFSPNYERNRDQLRFLEWYLTGKTDIEVSLESIQPLQKNSYFVAVGDWNTSYNSKENPGSEVLRSLYTKTKLWLSNVDQLSFTNEGNGYGMKPNRLMLDYIAYSKNIKMIKGEILHPEFTRTVLGCNATEIGKKPEGFVLATWKEKNKTCKAFVKKSYKNYKEASDHYPIIGVFELE